MSLKEKVKKGQYTPTEALSVMRQTGATDNKTYKWLLRKASEKRIEISNPSPAKEKSKTPLAKKPAHKGQAQRKSVSKGS